MNVVTRINRPVLLCRSAADDRDLAILRMRDKGDAIRSIATSLGLTDDVVKKRIEMIAIDDALEEAKAVGPPRQLDGPVTEPGSRTCLVPGCERKLNYRATAGVCQGHNHLKPYCQCGKCRSA